MQIVAIVSCGQLVYYVWVQGGLVRLDELANERHNDDRAGHESCVLRIPIWGGHGCDYLLAEARGQKVMGEPTLWETAIFFERMGWKEAAIELRIRLRELDARWRGNATFPSSPEEYETLIRCADQLGVESEVPAE